MSSTRVLSLMVTDLGPAKMRFLAVSTPSYGNSIEIYPSESMDEDFHFK